jgi:hypothetical protein
MIMLRLLFISFGKEGQGWDCLVFKMGWKGFSQDGEGARLKDPETRNGIG